MTRLSDWLRGRVHATAYPLYYRLPRGARRWLVRRVAPTYTVGAVVLLRDEADRLLLLRQPPGTRGWSLPAGLLARSESPIEGAARELAEETGVRLSLEQLQPATPNALVHPRGQWVDVVFEARVSSSSPLRVDGAEVLEAAWYDVAALPPLTRATAYLLSQYGLAELPSPVHDSGARSA